MINWKKKNPNHKVPQPWEGLGEWLRRNSLGEARIQLGRRSDRVGRCMLRRRGVRWTEKSKDQVLRTLHGRKRKKKRTPAWMVKGASRGGDEQDGGNGKRGKHGGTFRTSKSRKRRTSIRKRKNKRPNLGLGPRAPEKPFWGDQVATTKKKGGNKGTTRRLRGNSREENIKIGSRESLTTSGQ